MNVPGFIPRLGFFSTITSRRELVLAVKHQVLVAQFIQSSRGHKNPPELPSPKPTSLHLENRPPAIPVGLSYLSFREGKSQTLSTEELLSPSKMRRTVQLGRRSFAQSCSVPSLLSPRASIVAPPGTTEKATLLENYPLEN